MLHRRMLVLLSTILFVKNLQGLKIYKYGSVRIPYMEVIGERGKRHFVYANLLIWIFTRCKYLALTDIEGNKRVSTCVYPKTVNKI